MLSNTNSNVTVIESNTPEETFALGVRIGQEAKPGQVYTLIGDLGVGKLFLLREWRRDWK